jgi:hypothetical protein
MMASLGRLAAPQATSSRDDVCDIVAQRALRRIDNGCSTRFAMRKAAE